jgi:hypothetical protein
MKPIENFKDAAGRLRVGDWIQTYSGLQCFPLDPRGNEYRLIDIAAALSKLTRFGGHCLRYYSVAEHCVMLARHALAAGLDRRTARAMLFHDASEAYLIDVPRPIKGMLGGYTEIEDGLMRAIAASPRLDFDFPLPAIVKEYDTAILNDEMFQLMSTPPAPWRHGGRALGLSLEGWLPDRAFAEYMLMAAAVGVAP